MGTYVEAAQRAMQKPSWPGGQTEATATSTSPRSTKVWQCKGQLGCGYRFNSYSSQRCSICSKDWWRQFDSAGRTPQGIVKIPTTPPRWNMEPGSVHGAQHGPWQLAASGRKGTGQKTGGTDKEVENLL